MPPTVLVFGAAGRTGSAVIDDLMTDHEEGRIELVAAVRRPDAAAVLEARGIAVRSLDLDTAERRGLDPVIDVLSGVDRVFLLSGYDVRMLAQSKAVIDAAVATDVSHIVHLGVHAAPDSTIVHFGWHQMVESYIERTGIGYTHLHPTSFMQNLLLPGTADPATGVLTHFIGDAAPSWVDTDDLAAVAAEVLRDPADHQGRSYGLGTEVAAPADIAEMIGDATGNPWRYEAREPADFYAAMTANGADPVYMACVSNVFERTREGSVPDGSDVFDTVERVVGRAPITLQAFVERHITHFRPAPAR
ncbi:NmrA family NAD(P)-binding protein [Actinomycetes bacterium KLBMP 9759]